MKLGLLIKNDTRNIFLEKLYTKCGEEIISRLFSKISKLSLSLDLIVKVLYSLLLLYVNFRAFKIY